MSLLGIYLLACVLCSGIASLLVGPEAGWYVAVTFGVLFLGFGVISLVSILFVGVRRGESSSDDNHT